MTEILAVFCVSMLPTTGLGESLPVGVELGFSMHEAYALTVAGAMIPVPFLLLLMREMCERFFPLSVCENHRGNILFEYKEPLLLLLAAVPLPIAGTWLSAAAAAVMRVSFKRSVVIIIMGTAISALTVVLAETMI